MKYNKLYELGIWEGFIFLRGNCLLSVSHPYLALDGIYHPIGTAFPNNICSVPRILRCIAKAVTPGQVFWWQSQYYCLFIANRFVFIIFSPILLRIKRGFSFSPILIYFVSKYGSFAPFLIIPHQTSPTWRTILIPWGFSHINGWF